MTLLLLACRASTPPALEATWASQGADLIIGLHGRGDTAASFARVLPPETGKRTVILQAPTPYGDGWTWFDGREGPEVEQAADLVAAWIDHHDEDADVTVFGFSQGGYLALALATRHPHLIDRSVAIGGDLPRSMWPEAAPGDAPSMVVLHGEDDTVIPIGPTRSSVEHLQRKGWDVTFETYPGVGHSIPAPVRERLWRELRPTE